MVNLGGKEYLGWFEWIVRGEPEVEEKQSALVWRIRRPHDGGLPRINIVPYWPRRTFNWWRFLEFLVFPCNPFHRHFESSIFQYTTWRWCEIFILEEQLLRRTGGVPNRLVPTQFEIVPRHLKKTVRKESLISVQTKLLSITPQSLWRTGYFLRCGGCDQPPKSSRNECCTIATRELSCEAYIDYQPIAQAVSIRVLTHVALLTSLGASRIPHIGAERWTGGEVFKTTEQRSVYKLLSPLEGRDAG